jgi:DNA polymerase
VTAVRQFRLFDDDLQPARAEAPPPGSPVEAPSAKPAAGIDDRAERMEALRLPALGCTRCGLAATRTHVVFGEGNPCAPLVFVGEGPGENEDATGRPFVGRAGKLLDEVLRRNGMTREHVYICNVIKCRAAAMQNGRWINRPPAAEEIAACQPWLEQQLGIIKPLVLVCLGAPAASTMIHRGFRMTSERGRWFTSSPYAPWATAAFHPAYVLRLHGPAYDAALDTLIEDVAAARRKVIEAKKEAQDAPPPPRTLFD